MAVGGLPNFFSTFHKLYILGQFGDGEEGHISVKKTWYKLSKLGKGSIEKNVFFRALPELWGGWGLPMPEFLALFLEVHFWSIKRVYFFKNANVLNF